MSECKGLVYRYSEQQYIGKNGDINLKKNFRPLKRLSCDGSCKQTRHKACDKSWLQEWLNEYLCNGLFPDLPDSLKDQDIVKLCYKGYGGSYEYPNECDIELFFKGLDKECSHE